MSGAKIGMIRCEGLIEWRNAVGVERFGTWIATQGSRCATTLGWRAERRWRSALWAKQNPRRLMLLRLFGRQLPRLVRIVFVYRAGYVGGFFAQVLLIDLAIGVHNERHDARLAPLDRISHQRETRDHVAV